MLALAITLAASPPIVQLPTPGPRPTEIFSCRGLSRSNQKESSIELKLQGGVTDWSVSSQARVIQDRNVSVVKNTSPLELSSFTVAGTAEAFSGTIIMMEKGPPPQKIRATLEYDPISKKDLSFVPLIIRAIPTGYDLSVAQSPMPIMWLGTCSRTVTKGVDGTTGTIQ